MFLIPVGMLMGAKVSVADFFLKNLIPVTVSRGCGERAGAERTRGRKDGGRGERVAGNVRGHFASF
jgi:hypothetical protein